MSAMYEKVENICGVPVFSGRGVDGVKEAVLSLSKGGFIAILYDPVLKEYGEDLAVGFAREKHQVLSTCLVSEIPDNARFIIGVGTGSVAYAVRRKSAQLGVDSALVFSAPTTDTILTKYKNLGSFKAVFLDRTLLESCPRQCIASGWGIALSEPFRRFEEYYNHKVMDGVLHVDTHHLLPNATPYELAVYLLKISPYNHHDDNATVMAKVLYDSAKRQGIKPRLIGEYKFVSSVVISTLYENFLSSPSIDCMLPPSHDVNLDKLHHLTGRSMENLLKAFDFFDADSYFRVGYILSEYRLDLLERLKGADLCASQKKWRRLYADAGYWLKSAFTTHSLTEAMKLSAEIGDGLLRYIAESGFAEAC
jgi:hypothetical protein